MNNTFDANCSVYIYKSEHVKDYLLYEEFLEKKSFIPDGIEVFGFFMLNGDIVTRAKALFAKFFAPEGMEPFCPQMCRLIQDVFNKFIEKQGITKDTFKRVDLSELFEPLMKRITFLIVFGKTEQVDPDSDEEKLYKMLYEITTVYKNLKSFIDHPIQVSIIGANLDPFIDIDGFLVDEHSSDLSSQIFMFFGESVQYFIIDPIAEMVPSVLLGHCLEGGLE